MSKNMGSIERILRVVVGAGVAVYFIFFTDGALRWLGVGGLVVLTTALVGFCPTWAILGINTKGSCASGRCITNK